jgi:regulatory protein
MPFMEYGRIMSRITKITAGKKRDKRFNIFLDEKFAFSVPAEVMVKDRLHQGKELTDEDIEVLSKSDSYYRCLNTAVRYLGYRPRSESEMKQRLLRGGFNPGCIEKVLTKLKEQGLIDDNDFARFWKENRETFSPRSRRLTGLELQSKGLDRETIEEIIDEVDDEKNAYKAATGKAHRLSLSDKSAFSRKMSDFLRRRGFGYDVINHTVEKVWKEYCNVHV